MASLLIVSGAPGTGKTTLAAALAAAAPRGLHLASDAFYRFPARLVDPTTPESRAQNATIVRAVGRAAAAFVEGGYDVLLDGVLGPWFLPQLGAELRGLAPAPEYVVLRARADDAVARVRRRDGPGASARVRHMHRAFADLGPLEGHALDTSDASPAQTRAELERRRAGGGLRLPAAAGLLQEAPAADELPQTRLIRAVRHRCREDPRVRAALMYGSFTRGEGDRHSDVEFYVFVEDAALADFDAEAWVRCLGPLRAFFTNEFGTRVAIFAGLVRGEFHFEPATGVERLREWTGVEGADALRRMRILDRDGALTRVLGGLRRRPLAAPVVQAVYDRLLNWFLLGCHVLARGERARALDALAHVHTFLLQLARVREASLAHWPTPSRGLERELSDASRARFRRCCADLGPGALESAYREVWSWSRELLEALCAEHRLDRREAVAEEVEARLAAGP